LAVLLGKFLLAMGCQLSPDARARRRISSSDVDQMAAFRWDAPPACGYGAVVEAAGKDMDVRASFGMIGMLLKCGMYGSCVSRA
jgi:hypothetical protein